MTVTGTPLDASETQRNEAQLLTDFTSSTPDLGWYVVNDNVMGGRSQGGFRQEKGWLHFAGSTNTRGGGFSSIRTKQMQLDLSEHAGIQLRVKGDGRRYTWRLTTGARFRGRQVGYWADFATEDGNWSTADIPFSSFVPRFRGFELDGPALDPSEITGMGLMIYDNQDGPFELQLSSVHAFKTDTAFTLRRYQWTNRVLVVSAANEDVALLKQQRDEVSSSRSEFEDRDMVLVTLLDTGPSETEDRELTTGEVAATRVELEIPTGAFALRLVGKDGSVKLSSQTATSMTEIYSLIDAMPMRQREKSSR